MRRLASMVLFGLVFAGGQALADETKLSFGGDEFVAGQSATINQPTIARDAFLAGYDVALNGVVQGNAHFGGFNVRDDAQVKGDVYAVGFTINIAGPTGGDLTAMGNTLNVAAAAPVSGNARLAGGLVTLSAPVSGSALVTARNLTLDGPITGDFSFFGDTISFGPNARVDGKVSIQAPAEIAVPASVAAADRVSFQPLAAPDYASQAGKTAEHVVNSFWPAVWATGIWWLLLFVVGLAFLALSPRLIEAMRSVSATKPFGTLGLGFLAFASVIGLVPITALTIIGLLVTPFFILFAVIMCALSYLAGAYLLGSLLIGMLAPLDSTAKRALALAASIVTAGLLGMVPVAGWLITLLLVVFGFGAIGQVTLGRWTRRGTPPPSEPLPTPATAAA